MLGDLASSYGVESHSFNPHASLLDIANYSAPIEELCISEGDPVSAMSAIFPRTRVTLEKTRSRKAHSIDIFFQRTFT